MGAGIDNASGRLLRKRIYLPVADPGMGYSIDILRVASQGASNALQENTLVLGTTAAVGNANLVGATAAADKNARLRSIANGNPIVVPLTGKNIRGLLVTTANDGVEYFGPIPYDLDRHRPVYFRAWWTDEAAAVDARTITWKVLQKSFAADAAIVAGDTALNTVIAAQASIGTSLKLRRGNQGVMNAGTLAATAIAWSLLVTMSAFNAALVENKYLLGLEIEYTRRIWEGRSMVRESSVDSDGYLGR